MYKRKHNNINMLIDLSLKPKKKSKYMVTLISSMVEQDTSNI